MNTTQESSLPLITIGMPTKNRSWCLPQVLARLEGMEYPKKKMKIIFVDGYSTDGTFTMLKEWKEREGQKYHDVLLIQEDCNIPEARNLCINRIVGDFLLFWDSDVIPPPDFIKRFVEQFHENDKLGMIGADYIYENEKSKNIVKNNTTHALYMGFTAIRKELFDHVPAFNEKLEVGEDTEFGIKVSEKTNYRIKWANEPVLHLKQKDTQQTGWTFSWLSYNFLKRGKQYAESYDTLPLFLKGRIAYYLLLPWVLSFPAYLLLFPFLSIYLVSFPLLYLCFGLFHAVKNMNVKRGTTFFFTFYIPTGIALSYGFLLHLFREAFSRG